MTERRLSPDEAALWRRVMATVSPIDPTRVPDAAPGEPAKPMPRRAATPVSAAPARIKVAPARPGPGTTLDGGWDRRLATGTVQPDSMIDLHGHSLDSAYQLLDRGLAQAIGRGDRVLLLVTGRPPRPESERPHARGRIRAAIDDWLRASRHAANIAAVRGAHPRHGGAGALYIVLRRDRTERKY